MGLSFWVLTALEQSDSFVYVCKEQGVFCQTAIESAQNDHTAVVHSILKNKQAHIQKIRALFNSIGDDETGIITFAMFEEKINSPAVKAYFEVLGLDVWDAPRPCQKGLLGGGSCKVCF